MVTPDEHKVYLGLGRELRNTLRPVSPWILLVCDDDCDDDDDDVLRGSLPALYSTRQGYRSKESNPSRLQSLYP
jgi:hypothetical protein